MNIGDYVRTIDRGIRKIDEWKDDIFYRDTQGRINTKDNVIKSNPGILELLEPMDLLYIDISPDNCGGIVVPRIPETLNELEEYIEKIKSGECILKYVVTHEQLEKDMYEVGE